MNAVCDPLEQLNFFHFDHHQTRNHDIRVFLYHPFAGRSHHFPAPSFQGGLSLSEGRFRHGLADLNRPIMVFRFARGDDGGQTRFHL